MVTTLGEFIGITFMLGEILVRNIETYVKKNRGGLEREIKKVKVRKP